MDEVWLIITVEGNIKTDRQIIYIEVNRNLVLYISTTISKKMVFEYATGPIRVCETFAS